MKYLKIIGIILLPIVVGLVIFIIYTPGKIQQSIINVTGELKKTVNLTPFKLGDPNDLDYAEDSRAETDMNVVMNDGGGFIELQGTAEGHAFRKHELDQMLVLADKGIRSLMEMQLAALAD